MTEETQVRGYLHALKPGETRSRPLPVLLMVACPHCGAWHTHGAGTIEAVLYAPGDIAYRSSHCRRFGGQFRIRIENERFRAAWCTSTNRISRAYRRFTGEVAER